LQGQPRPQIWNGSIKNVAFDPDPHDAFVPHDSSNNDEDSLESEIIDGDTLGSDDDRKPAARESVEPACISRPVPLQVMRRPWIDNALTEDMLKGLTKNPHRDFKQLIDQVLSHAKNEKTTGHIWLTLQCALEDVLTLTREDEKEQNKLAGIIGLPTNAADQRKTNHRTKRTTERQ
jgi:hypothetical protein